MPISRPSGMIMQLRVPFPASIRDWIACNLQNTCAPEELVRAMVSQNAAPETAQAMVAAVAQALRHGLPLPEGDIAIPAHFEYQPEPCRLPPGARLSAAGHVVNVHARFARPAGAVLGNMLTADECGELIELARPRLRRSTVVDPQSGEDVVADYRNSAGMFFRLGETPLLAAIDARIAALTGIPASHGEGVQVLRYPEGGAAAPHFDYLQPSNEANIASLARSGQRIATFVIYLNDVPAGGETLFPAAGISIAPQRGNAAYFEYGNRFGQLDPLSLHAGALVREGAKWVATKWLRDRPYLPKGETASL